MHNAEAQIALNLFQAIDTPRSLTAAIMLRYGLWDQLVSLTCDPRDYNDLYPQKYLRDAQATDFLRKADFLPFGGDLVSEAKERFLSVERENARTNARLSPIINNPASAEFDERIPKFFRDVRNLVAEVLGRMPDFVNPRFGPGATFDDRVPLTTVPDKMSSVPTLTPNAVCILADFDKLAWNTIALVESPNKSLPPTRVRGDRFTTVPKDARKRRSITVQPSINGAYQLGVGGFIRQRLRKYGIDLTEGQELHRRVACWASFTGAFATLDLSDASDTITKNFVQLCLPADWFALLSSLRCPLTRIDGKWLWNEKFSAMGNGYTFELETLLFLAVVTVASRLSALSWGKGLFAYGDDLIFPTECTDDVIAALRYCGFKPNLKKTFTKGSFRESCGGDFFKGAAVRPHFLKEPLHGPQDYISLANGIRRFTDQLAAITGDTDPGLLRFWHRLLDSVPTAVRSCRGPSILGDLVIHDRPESWTVRQSPVDPQQRLVRVYAPITTRLDWKHWRAPVVFASALYGASTEGVSPRDNVSGYRTKWVSLLEL